MIRFGPEPGQLDPGLHPLRMDHGHIWHSIPWSKMIVLKLEGGLEVMHFKAKVRIAVLKQSHKIWTDDKSIDSILSFIYVGPEINKLMLLATTIFAGTELYKV